MDEISIVILTFNSINFLSSCLDSLFNQGHPNLEVIVVDNGSGDGTVNFIKEHYPSVIIIENKENRGSCVARNQGIMRARGKWVLTLDCDVLLERNFFVKIAEILKNIPSDIGIIQPKILNLDKKTIYSCGIYLSWLRRFHDIGQGSLDSGQFNANKYIFGACSAAAIYNRKMLETVKENTGYFDQRFFFLVEDVDLSWRAQRKGWKAVFCPEIICYHSGYSSKVNNKFRQYLCFRNRYYSIKKNEGFRNYAKRIIPLLLYDFPRLVYFLLTNRYMFRKI